MKARNTVMKPGAGCWGKFAWHLTHNHESRAYLGFHRYATLVSTTASSFLPAAADRSQTVALKRSQPCSPAHTCPQAAAAAFGNHGCVLI
jgi:hypothetical protein